VDVRLIAATNNDLDSAMEAGLFRQDLYYRLSRMIILLPPLRERIDDVLVLCDYFIARSCKVQGRPLRRLSSAARDLLCSWTWPGNVRELENVVHRCVLAARGDQIELADLPPDLQSGAVVPASRPVALDDEEDTSTIVPLRELEERAIRNALRVTRGSVGRAAKLLGIGRATLYRRIAEIDDPISMRENAS
jgi:DNA-binding NtrC family response regulator